jgi:hypothetical protein
VVPTQVEISLTHPLEVRALPVAGDYGVIDEQDKSQV